MREVVGWCNFGRRVQLWEEGAILGGECNFWEGAISGGGCKFGKSASLGGGCNFGRSLTYYEVQEKMRVNSCVL